MPLDQTPWPENEDARILLRAAELIEEKGWCQYHGVDHEGGVCVIGAITMVNNSDIMGNNSNIFENDKYIHLVEDYLGIAHFSIWCWNDAASRTKEEVVAALRGAAYSLVNHNQSAGGGK